MTAPTVICIVRRGIDLVSYLIAPIGGETMIERVRPKPESSPSEPPVRGRPFKPGNPGRPPGSKNKTTKMLEELFEGEAEDLTRKIIELALAGNVRCLEYCVDRLLPRRRGEPINLELPKISRVKDIPAAVAVVVGAVSNGTITPEQASHVSRLLDSFANAITLNDVAARLENVESVLKIQGKM
jgi:hypothetical protein